MSSNAFLCCKQNPPSIKQSLPRKIFCAGKCSVSEFCNVLQTFSAEATLRMFPLGAENCSQQIHCSTQHSLPEETLQGCKPENAQYVALLQILCWRCLAAQVISAHKINVAAKALHSKLDSDMNDPKRSLTFSFFSCFCLFSFSSSLSFVPMTLRELPGQRTCTETELNTTRYYQDSQDSSSAVAHGLASTVNDVCPCAHPV